MSTSSTQPLATATQMPYIPHTGIRKYDSTTRSTTYKSDASIVSRSRPSPRKKP